ncbi:uncharacterized protein Triagg1_6776 [Trichoderma aggressivum f. europaeum]|uniref:Uncharacterized protein n=1 Tax=Trichoderma aggressivum f. europaeum TaxID=173218 RepID=A0AAE1IB39_9HYPO|nr:hypothetical protein Triagg1_6776 [Trichoderma aggressivum f. europaeum]
MAARSKAEQRIEGEKREAHDPSAADSNMEATPARGGLIRKPSPAQPSPSPSPSLIVFLLLLALLTHHQQSQDPASAGADWATVFHGRFRLEIAESHSLPYLTCTCFTAADGVSWTRFQIHVPSCPVMGLGGCETLPSWSQTASPLTGRPVNTTCNFAAERQKQRSACMAGVGCSHPIRDATGTARNALAERAPIGHPLSGQYHESMFFSWVRLARSQGRYWNSHNAHAEPCAWVGEHSLPEGDFDAKLPWRHLSSSPRRCCTPYMYGGLGSIRHGVTPDDKGSHACMILDNLEHPSKRNLKIPTTGSSTSTDGSGLARSRRYASMRSVSPAAVAVAAADARRPFTGLSTLMLIMSWRYFRKRRPRTRDVLTVFSGSRNIMPSR